MKRRAARTQDHSPNFGRIMRAIRGDLTLAGFAKKIGVSVASVRRAEDGWLPNFRCGGNVASKAGISGHRWDYGDCQPKTTGQVRTGL